MALTVADFPYEVPELHCHVRSDKDAFIFPGKLAERLKELGMPGIAITDHGVVSSIEDYRHVLQAEGLKVIPGCELYIDGGRILGRQHGIVLAVDDEGWHGIEKIVTRANETMQGSFPVISSDELKSFGRKYPGHIIFMTACMQGVISTIFLSNSKIDRLIEKAEKKQKKYLSPDSAAYKGAEAKLAHIDSEIEELKMLRDDDKRLAEMRFGSREKKIGKLEEGPEKDAALKELEEDKEASEKAKTELARVKDDLKKMQRKRTAANRELISLADSVKKYEEYRQEIEGYRASSLSREQMQERAENELLSYAEAFGRRNVYAEVQYHGIPDEKICFPVVAEAARKLRIPLVATNDVHMLTNSEDDILRRCLIRSLRFGKNFEEPSPSDRELYLKTTDERIKTLSEILPEDIVFEALINAVKIFEKCNVEFKTEKHYPEASSHPREDIEKLVRKGITWRFPDGFPDEKIYNDRIKYELGIIEGMGYDNYHLVVREFLTYGTLLGKVPKKMISDAPLDTDKLIEWIKENGWEDNAGYRIGTGRGSDGGSLVCYLLGITNLDPIKYGLIFERFLNPERVSMPDIDSDISADTRQKVIDHVKYVYGDKAVCGIMTTNAQGPKGCLAIGSKFYGLRTYGTSLRTIGDTMSKDVPSAPGTSFATQIDRNTGKIDECSDDTISVMEYLKDKYVDADSLGKADDCREILHYASVMEGVFTSYGAHAAGIVIMKKGADVSDVLALMYNRQFGMMTTQCSKDDVEANGLLKFDFLGLKTLDIITEALQMIQKRTGKAIDVLKLDTADQKIYKDIFQSGNTKAVFQFESDGMRSMLKRFRPTEFSDLVLLNAAYRPGPIQYLDDIIEVKNGRKEITYLTPELEPILKDTYGAMIYQEQVMQVCQSLAGYSFGGADLVRRAMSKKKKEKLEHERKAFIYGDPDRNIKGCVNNGISESAANKIFDQMMHFASYAFNKSHAAAYAYNAYITAWLKEYYPAEFFAAALNWAADREEVSELIYDARASGIKVLPPDINRSAEDFTADDGEIRFALSAVKGIKTGAQEIVKERSLNGPFSSEADLCLRTGIGKSAAENLIYAGASGSFTDNREALVKVLPDIMTLTKELRDRKAQKAACEAVLGAGAPETDEAVIRVQEDAGIKVCLKKAYEAYKLENKAETLDKDIGSIKRELTLRTADESIYEDKKARLQREKEMLGLYVSASPLDYCPEAEDLDTPCRHIDEADMDTARLYGICGNIRITKRKRDGAGMAFFTLSDRTGEIPCACFTRTYPYIKGLITDGNVIVAEGNMMKNRGRDEEGSSMQFSVSSVSAVSSKKNILILGVNSYALFHIEKEDAFREKYEDENGRKFLIYDEDMNEFREPKYRISADVLQDRNYRIKELR